MAVYWVGIEFDGCSELGIEAKDLAEAVEVGKKAALEALYRRVNLWIASANSGQPPEYLCEQTTVKWRPIDEIMRNLGSGNN